MAYQHAAALWQVSVSPPAIYAILCITLLVTLILSRIARTQFVLRHFVYAAALWPRLQVSRMHALLLIAYTAILIACAATGARALTEIGKRAAVLALVNTAFLFLGPLGTLADTLRISLRSVITTHGTVGLFTALLSTGHALASANAHVPASKLLSHYYGITVGAICSAMSHEVH